MIDQAIRIFVAVLCLGAQHLAFAGQADVLDAQLRDLGDGRIQVSATIKHDDAGWDHYADRFEVLDPKGSVIATRVLMHPHVEEQPFTRATEPFRRPAGVAVFTIRARDSRHGFGGATFELRLPTRSPDG